MLFLEQCCVAICERACLGNGENGIVLICDNELGFSWSIQQWRPNILESLIRNENKSAINTSCFSPHRKRHHNRESSHPQQEVLNNPLYFNASNQCQIPTHFVTTVIRENVPIANPKPEIRIEMCRYWIGPRSLLNQNSLLFYSCSSECVLVGLWNRTGRTASGGFVSGVLCFVGFMMTPWAYVRPWNDDIFETWKPLLLRDPL